MAAVARRRTKIGPASSERACLRALFAAGLDGARLNLSHGTHEEHAERVRLLREVQAEHDRPIALIADLQGPKLRVGDLPAPWVLERGQDVELIGAERPDNGALPVSPAVIGDVLRPGHDVLIDDGLIRLKVEQVVNGRIRCAVVVGGEVGAHKGVNLPGVPLPIPSLTRKDVDDLAFALSLGVDFVALSFVRSAADIRDLRKLVGDAGSRARLIAKIEKAEAIADLDAVLAEADAIMVARGDLGVEMGPAAVPLLQKRIILRTLEQAKPVITATQMLESMIHNFRPTRAEASDVANAVLDGADAVMLSGETSVGSYPIETVQTMARIVSAVEGGPASVPPIQHVPRTQRGVVTTAARDIGERLNARALVAFTRTGDTVRRLARLHTRLPVLAFTPIPEVRSQLSLSWGVETFLVDWADTTDAMIRQVDACLLEIGRFAVGELVVIVSGSPPGTVGKTNLLRVHKIGEDSR
jgi:pyruvate kinase